MPAPAAPRTEPRPELPYLPKPTSRPADWLTEHPPVNAEASPEARALLRFLYSLSGRHTLTGQHNFPGEPDYSTRLATAQTGKTPALYGADWGFAAPGDKDSAYVRRDTVQELTRRWQDGSIVTLCWHAVPPTRDEPVTFSGEVQSTLSDAEWRELLTPDTSLHTRWLAQVDAVTEYLCQLRDARVPVLWRPLHEINGDWFWWNGRRGDDGTKELYRLLYTRLTDFHGLNNLLWVWNPDRPARADRQFVDYFPGHEYVDVLALDCYGAFEQSYYDDLNALSDGKVMAIGETYDPPAPEAYLTQPKWAFYMTWATDTPADGILATGADRPDLRAMVNNPRLLSLHDPAYVEVVNPLRSACGLPPLPPAP